MATSTNPEGIHNVSYSLLGREIERKIKLDLPTIRVQQQINELRKALASKREGFNRILSKIWTVVYFFF
jgi:hypothetical protein